MSLCLNLMQFCCCFSLALFVLIKLLTFAVSYFKGDSQYVPATDPSLGNQTVGINGTAEESEFVKEASGLW